MPQAPPTTSQKKSLPDDFLVRMPSPKFQLGDRVRFVPIPSNDFGIITGLQFAPAEHLEDWTWRYVVWLDDQSPSRAWTCSDLAWEDDLQLLFPAPINLLKEQPA